jgi:hypothetical protein
MHGNGTTQQIGKRPPSLLKTAKPGASALRAACDLASHRTPFQHPSSWPQKAGISRTRTVLQLTRQHHAPRCNSVLSTRPCAGPRPYDLPIPSIMLAATWQPSVAAVAGNLTSTPPPNQAEDHPPHTTCTGQGQACRGRQYSPAHSKIHIDYRSNRNTNQSCLQQREEQRTWGLAARRQNPGCPPHGTLST